MIRNFCSFIFPLSLVLLGVQNVWPQELEKRIEKVKSEGQVVWYTSMLADQVQVFNKAFESKYPSIRADAYRASSEKVVQKIITEANAGRYAFDIVASSSFDNYLLQKKGLLGKYLSQERKFYRERDKDEEGYWTAMWFVTWVVGYNTNIVRSEEVPKSYSDLLIPQWQGKIGLDDQNYEWFATMLAAMGREKGMAFMKRLSGQKLEFRSGHPVLTQMVVAGEIPLAFLYFHHVASEQAKKAPIDWARIEPVIQAMSTIAVSSKAPHPESARLFIDFGLSKEGQQVIRSFNREPARPDVSPIVQGLSIRASHPKMAEDYDRYQREFKQAFSLP